MFYFVAIFHSFKYLQTFAPFGLSLFSSCPSCYCTFCRLCNQQFTIHRKACMLSFNPVDRPQIGRMSKICFTLFLGGLQWSTVASVCIQEKRERTRKLSVPTVACACWYRRPFSKSSESYIWSFRSLSNIIPNNKKSNTQTQKK